jgi:hypothetical protein
MTAERAAAMLQRVYKGSKVRRALKGWMKVVDTSDGDVFFRNVHTGELSWELPAAPFQRPLPPRPKGPHESHHHHGGGGAGGAGGLLAGTRPPYGSRPPSAIDVELAAAAAAVVAAAGTGSRPNTAPPPPLPPAPAGPPLPPGWQIVTDGEETWYFNESTGESLWEPPPMPEG